MQEILDVVVPIFGLMAVGYLVARFKLLSEATGDALSRYVFVVAVPVLIFRSLAGASFAGANPFCLWGCYFGSVALVWTAGTMIARRLLAADRRKGVVAGISSAFKNTVFVAVPLLQRAYGEAGLEPLLLLISVHLPLMMIASTLLMERAASLDVREAGTGAASPSMKAVLSRVARNLSTNAIVAGIVAGVLWRLTGLGISGPAGEVVTLLGSTAGPVALFSLGMSLTRYGLRGDLRAAALTSALSLVVLPALVWGVGQFALPPHWLKGAVMTAACPAGVNAYLLAAHFKSGERLASTSILVSTLASVVTLSVWLTLVG